MNPIRNYTLTVLCAAVLAACSSIPRDNPSLIQARSDYEAAQSNTQTRTLAPTELKQAGDTLAQAEAAHLNHDNVGHVNHLAYLTGQRVTLANQAAARKGAEATVAQAATERDQLRLDARTREADAATQNAAVATRDAATSQRQAAASQRQADASQRQAADSQQQAVASQQMAAVAAQQAGEAEARSQALERQLRELNAKKTDRGLVITIGDVLFDTGQAQLKTGGVQSMQRLSGFLKEYPKRRAMIEGYTDSVGSDSTNLALSGRRADAVLGALLGMGVDRAQLASQGYGESHPVAGNENAGGRQMNRRVEIVLSDESGVIAPR